MQGRGVGLAGGSRPKASSLLLLGGGAVATAVAAVYR